MYSCAWDEIFFLSLDSQEVSQLVFPIQIEDNTCLRPNNYKQFQVETEPGAFDPAHPIVSLKTPLYEKDTFSLLSFYKANLLLSQYSPGSSLFPFRIHKPVAVNSPVMVYPVQLPFPQPVSLPAQQRLPCLKTHH